MTALYAFYDGECGPCSAGRNWLSNQPQLVPIRFVPYQSEEARRLCPELPNLHPDREIVVLSDTGEIYQGDGAWITLLWATYHWRSMAVDLSKPGLRGMARKVIEAISENRMTLSKWLGMKREGTDGMTKPEIRSSKEIRMTNVPVPPAVIIRAGAKTVK